jgi:hypothetical protein
MIRRVHLYFLCCTSTRLWTLKHNIITRREHVLNWLNSIIIFLLAPACPSLHKSTTTPTCIYPLCIYPPAALATFTHIQQSSPHLHTCTSTHASTRLGLPPEVHTPTIYSARKTKFVLFGSLVGIEDWPGNVWGAVLAPKDLLLLNPFPICLSILLIIGLYMI